MAMLDRRTFLGGSLGAVVLFGRPAIAGTAPDGTPLYASCVRKADGTFAVAVVDLAGEIKTLHPLPDRGHDVAFDPVSGRCVAFARRPGTFAVVFDLPGGKAPQLITAVPDRHFYGHGVFSADGNLLYATENAISSGEGRIGIYDVRDGFRRVHEVPSGGIGPHELVWCADGRTLVIANGGLETDPAFARRNLNTSELSSSLALLDVANGSIVATTTAGAELGMLSIRHLAVDASGAVWFGCQSEGDPLETPPLVGRLSADGAVQMIELPEDLRFGPRNYIGSVAVSGDGRTVALSAPRGGIVLGFDTATRAFLGSIDLKDGCGLAPWPGRSAGYCRNRRRRPHGPGWRGRCGNALHKVRRRLRQSHGASGLTAGTAGTGPYPSC